LTEETDTEGREWELNSFLVDTEKIVAELNNPVLCETFMITMILIVWAGRRR
jgi:hypothetical protein